MILTYDNYHSLEANRAYMSASQYAGFMRCQARQLAIINGDYEEPDKDAYILGSYVDRALLTPDVLAADKQANPDVYAYNKKPRAFVLHGDAMTDRCLSDVYFREQLTGDNQVIFTFSLGGIEWRAMLDVCNFDTETIVDLKTVGRSLDYTVWSDEHECRVPFYEAFGYWRQLAIYREAYKSHIGKHPKRVLIAAVTKEEPPDIGVFSFSKSRRFTSEIDQIMRELPAIIAVKSGHALPSRCEVCDYCRATRVLKGAIDAESCVTATVTLEEFAQG